jgi:hypothetical protein
MRRRLLHLLVRGENALAAEIIAQQRRLPDHEIAVVDLSHPDCDYEAVLEEVFRADSIQVW